MLYMRYKAAGAGDRETGRIQRHTTMPEGTVPATRYVGHVTSGTTKCLRVIRYYTDCSRPRAVYIEVAF